MTHPHSPASFPSTSFITVAVASHCLQVNIHRYTFVFLAFNLAGKALPVGAGKVKTLGALRCIQDRVDWDALDGDTSFASIIVARAQVCNRAACLSGCLSIGTIIVIVLP